MEYRESLYELANQIFDEEVFCERNLLDAYNSIDGEEGREALFDIVGDMMHEATSQMRRVARENKEWFASIVEEHAQHKYEIEVHSRWD